MFTTVTQVKCQPGKSSEVKDLCLSLLTEIRQNPGCISVDLYADDEDVDNIVFIACWESQKFWRDHIESQRQRELADQAASPEGRKMMESWRSQFLHRVS